MLEKRKVLKACIQAQEKKIEDLKQSLEKTAQMALEAPSSRTSWSDTTRFQQGNLALGIQKELIEANLSFAQLRTLSLVANNVISVGTVFSLKDINNGEITNYFLIPEGGGASFKVNGEEILSISLQAPIAKSVLGKLKGMIAPFRDKIFEIVDVQ